MANKYNAFSQLLQSRKESELANKKKQIAIEKQKAVASKRLIVSEIIPLDKLKSRFEYSCTYCNAPILFDTLYIDDFSGRYIPLSETTMKPHKCWFAKEKERRRLINELP